MIKINIKTKVGYRTTNINPDNLIYYRKTKYINGYSKKSEKIIKSIHEKVIEEKAVKRYKKKILEIRVYQQKRKELKREKKELKRKELIKKGLKPKEEPKPKEPIKHYYNWLCNCLVSDRLFPHIFGVSNLIGSDEEYVIREHEKYYPEHELKSIELFDESGENQKELHNELKDRKEYMTKTKGIYFYD